jgi:hypothetical protein
MFKDMVLTHKLTKLVKIEYKEVTSSSTTSIYSFFHTNAFLVFISGIYYKTILEYNLKNLLTWITSF